MFNKVYELPLARNYVRHWGIVEALRELFQNAIDADSPFEYQLFDGGLSISSRFSKLEPKTLLLGNTTKAENKDKIGSFGEGYKIALLVLTREGCSVDIYNGTRLWKPEFRYSRTYEEDVLCITDSTLSHGNEGLTFSITGLSQQDIDQVIESNLHMQNHIGKIKSTPYGDILYEKAGKLYVGGLYVSDTKTKFGYNIKPEFLKLERDRQTVDSFDLGWITKEMWAATKDTDEIVSMLEEEFLDVEYFRYSSPEIVKEACYAHFRKQHPEELIASSKKELDQLIKKSLTVYIGASYGSVVQSSDSYKKEHHAVVRTVEEELKEFFEKHRSNMRRPAIVAFKQILKKASTWKK